MKESFGFDVPWHVRTKNLRQNFFCGLHQALGPAGLLGFEAVHVDRKLAGAFNVWQVEKFPAFELRAIREVSVFGKGVVLPAAGGINCSATPDTGSTVEIKKSATAGTGAVLDDEMAVQKNGFDLRQERVIAIEIGPARLRHADFGILKIRNGPAEEIGFGDE